MPLYEYKCDGCGETFEVIQKFADDPLTVHEKCGGAVHRLLSAPAFQFKGTGWYATDYAKGNTTGPPKHDSKSELADKASSDSAAKTDTKTETKSESKPESKPATTEKAS